MIALASHLLCQASIIGACFSVSFGFVRLVAWRRAAEYRRRDAEFRAYALVAESQRAARAGQLRAAERSWSKGRAANG